MDHRRGRCHLNPGNAIPVWKTLETPLVALDESHVEMLSLLVLFGLGLLALLVRRNRQTILHLIQMISILVFFYVVYSCLGVFGMIRNGLHGLTLIGTVFTEAFFWMSLPVVVIAFSLLSGPAFCGWICPTGTLQELVSIPRERLGRWVTRRGWFSSLRSQRVVGLAVLAIFLAGFVGFVLWLGEQKDFYVEDSSLYWASSLLLLCFMVLAGWADDQALRVLRALSFWIIVISSLLKTAIVSPVHFAFANVSDPASMLTTLVLMLASLFVSRAWCRYICPFGYLMGQVHRYSRLGIQGRAGCQSCNRCGEVCRVRAIENGRIHAGQCQFCMACVDACPDQQLKVIDRWKTEGKP